MSVVGVGIERPETRAGIWHVGLCGLGSCCDGRHVGLEDLNENGFSAALAPGVVDLFCFSLRFPFATVVASELLSIVSMAVQDRVARGWRSVVHSEEEDLSTDPILKQFEQVCRIWSGSEEESVFSFSLRLRISDPFSLKIVEGFFSSPFFVCLQESSCAQSDFNNGPFVNRIIIIIIWRNCKWQRAEKATTGRSFRSRENQSSSDTQRVWRLWNVLQKTLWCSGDGLPRIRYDDRFLLYILSNSAQGEHLRWASFRETYTHMAKCNEEERNIGHRERDLIRRAMEWRAMRRKMS